MKIPTDDEVAEVIESDRVISFVHHAQKRKKPCGGNHQRFVIDEQHGTVECAECGDNVSAFHALLKIARKEGRYREQMYYARKKLEELAAYKPWLRAVKEIERLWRGRKMLPVCRFCNHGLEPEDISGSMVSVEFERQRRKKQK